MSRIGKKLIALNGAKMHINDEYIYISGSLGTISQKMHPFIKIIHEGNLLKCISVNKSREANAMFGTMRALIANMVYGVNNGFEKKLLLIGVGYKAQIQDRKLCLSLGFSHTIFYSIPEDIKIELLSSTEIIIKGINKQKVGQVSSEIRSYRPPEPYKGKGIRYSNEIIILKETKKK